MVGYVMKRKEATTRPTLSAVETKVLGTVAGVGALLALLNLAARGNAEEIREEAHAQALAEKGRSLMEIQRQQEIAKMRKLTEDQMRLAMSARGMDVMHPGIDPTSPALVAAAMERSAKPLGYVRF